jgi:AraC-like DNA-binding protein
MSETTTKTARETMAGMTDRELMVEVVLGLHQIKGILGKMGSLMPMLMVVSDLGKAPAEAVAGVPYPRVTGESFVPNDTGGKVEPKLEIMKPVEREYTLQELMPKLHMSASHLSRLCRKGVLKNRKIGKSYYVPESELTRLNGGAPMGKDEKFVTTAIARSDLGLSMAKFMVKVHSGELPTVPLIPVKEGETASGCKFLFRARDVEAVSAAAKHARDLEKNKAGVA